MPRGGNSKDRGYGYAHQQERKRLKPSVDAGQAYCTATNCLMPNRWIQPGTPWDVGHNVARTEWTGPEHGRCNRSDGARRGNILRGQRRHGATWIPRPPTPPPPPRSSQDW